MALNNSFIYRAFFGKATSKFWGMLVFTALLACFCFDRFFLSDALQPAHLSMLPWKLETSTNVHVAGSPAYAIKDARDHLIYSYELTDDVRFPFVSSSMIFTDSGNVEKLVDLSKYSTITFNAKCTPKNSLSIFVHTFDEQITKLGDFHSYRMSEAVFSCHEYHSTIEVDLRRLNVPAWWLDYHQKNPSDQHYQLDKVIAISFHTTRKSPLNTLAQVEISKLSLDGYAWQYAWLFTALLSVSWSFYFFWLLKFYKKKLIDDLEIKTQKGQTLPTYQQLSIEPHKDKVKSQVLDFIAKEYANSEMSMDFAVAKLGINRNKINDILKQEFDLTFNAYLNKLRLIESARLLSENGGSHIAEIAYLVGYNNVPYFNTLFKKEYGCTPGKFKSTSLSGKPSISIESSQAIE